MSSHKVLCLTEPCTEEMQATRGWHHDVNHVHLLCEIIVKCPCLCQELPCSAQYLWVLLYFYKRGDDDDKAKVENDREEPKNSIGTSEFLHARQSSISAETK